ncbi:MAG: Cellulose 1,4-beta-cellobiosidase [Candidatus Magasanikbacteria bacterium GW2011_GWA2_40_10]|uniref:Cellulose 1,4-beta-cellobiosidase n=1 Tax=Candidatus Magasanikbacteria bacterium GW2011_GWA2_40_10 TaxID=1619037 RepID=A0A0G0TAW1_9BACT|nr:MAG: Cellulose 1,4-beta-cellobiosidase [Candidatus Magasanikbacteria bacterium GW2011_GWA2_40_10]
MEKFLVNQRLAVGLAVLMAASLVSIIYALPGLAQTSTSSGDITPPSVPASVSATPLSTSSIQISWSASTDNVGISVYHVYRGGVQIETMIIPDSVFSYTDTGLSPGTSYSYTVAAQDPSNNISSQSSPVSGITPTLTTASTTLSAPTKPSIFTAYASDSNVGLYWEGNYPYPTPESEAKVYRRLQGNSSWTLIYSKNYNPAYISYDRYTDAGLANAIYEYHINFCNSGGCSVDSNTATVTVGGSTTATTLGPIGYWKFDGNGNNEISGGSSAVIVGNAAFNSSGGKLGGYLYIPTGADWAKIPYSSIFDLPNSFTIEFWFRQRADRSFLQDLVYKGTPINNYSFKIFRQLWNQYNFGPVMMGSTAANTGFWSSPTNSNQLSHGSWHHVVYTRNSSEAVSYLDGAVLYSLNFAQYSEYSGPVKTPANDIIIGDSAVDTDIDNLRIYNRALSFDEVLQNGGFSAQQQICALSAKQCSGSLLQECASDRFSWFTLQSCQYGCNSNTLSCNTATSPTSTTPPTSTTAPSVNTAPSPSLTPTPTQVIIPSLSSTSTPISSSTSTPIGQCLQAGGLWCYGDYPASLLGYCAPAKSACERGDQSPRAILPQPPAVNTRVEIQTMEQFLAERRAVLQDLRELERLVKRDIIEINTKQLKILKEKILSLKPKDKGYLSVLQAYQTQLINLQSDVPTSTELEHAIDPRQEAKALQQLKQGLRLFERHIATIEKKAAQIEKSKLTIDVAIKETISTAKDLARKVKEAKSYNDIRDIAEQIPDVGQALNDALPRLEELLRLPSVLRLADRRIADAAVAIKLAGSSAKRLKLDVSDELERMQTILAEAKSAAITVKTGGATENLQDMLQEQVFDKLDNIFDLADHIRAVTSVRQAVNRDTANVRRYEARLRRLKADSENRQTASELLGEFKTELASLKKLSAQKLTPDIGEQIIDRLNVMTYIKTDLEDTLGLSAPDATQKQIQRLFSSTNEKIKPFQVEQLEKGVL